jgi:hypothetical protein
VTSGIDIAANDVDETVSDPSHEGVTGTDCARLNSPEFPWLPSFVRRSCPRARLNRAKQLGFERVEVRLRSLRELRRDSLRVSQRSREARYSEELTPSRLAVAHAKRDVNSQD